MRKGLIFISLLLMTFLVACDSLFVKNETEYGYSEEDIRKFIKELMPENQYTNTYDMKSFEEAIVSMANQSSTSVVGIISTNASGGGTGSGVIYKNDGDKYYVVTNHHVVENSIDVSVLFEKNGMLFEIESKFVELLGSDPTTDLAVLTFQSEEIFTVIEFADSYELQKGQIVFAIGNPLGFEFYGTLTMGVISGLSRYVEDEEFNATLIQHDAAISPGNSGGALLNTDGLLVGINNMKIVEENVSNIGFAIPSNTVKRIVDDLEDGKITRPFLGITAYPLTNECGVTEGLCLKSVDEDGAGGMAGLKEGDIVIGFKNETEEMTEFLDIDNFNDFREAILNSKVGDRVVIRYIRDGVIKESLPVQLNIHPEDK